MKDANGRFEGTVSTFATRYWRKYKFGYLMIIFSLTVLLYKMRNCKQQHGNSAQYNFTAMRECRITVNWCAKLYAMLVHHEPTKSSFVSGKD